MHRNNYRLALVVLAVVTTLAGAALAQGGGNVKRAELLAKAAEELAREGDYGGAAKLFEKAHELTGEPILLHNIGRMYDKKGDLGAARQYYELFLQKATDPADLELGKKRLEQVLDRIPGRVWVETDPMGARVVVDDKDVGQAPVGPLELRRGLHRVSASLPGREVAQKDVTVEPGGEMRVRLALTPLAPPAPPRAETGPKKPAAQPQAVARVGPAPRSRFAPWQWVAMGAGAAGIVCGGVLTYLAGRDRDQVTGADRKGGVVVGMSQPDAVSLADAADKKDKASYALYAIGGAAVVTGVVLWVLDATGKGNGVAVYPMAGPSGEGVAFAWGF